MATPFLRRVKTRFLNKLSSLNNSELASCGVALVINMHENINHFSFESSFELSS